jgi:D-threo-aldose 1-dehydrogenase
MALPLGLGCAPLAGLYEPVDEATARATVDAAWEAGIRAFDTAPLYGFGLSERRVGAALRERPRDEYVLSSKVGRLIEPGGGRPPPEAEQFPGAGSASARVDYSRDGVLRSLEASLERLGVDRLDIVYIHDPDDHMDAALGEAYPALEELRRQGVVRAVGAGMNQAPALARFVRETEVDCVLLAGRYTLLDQTAAEDLLPACLERGVAVVAGGVLNSGILGAPRPGARYDYAPASAKVVERARALVAVCERHGVPLVAAALRFPLGHPAVTSVLVGARSPREVTEDARLFAQEIPPALWQELRAEGLIAGDVPVPAAAPS